MVFLCCFKGMYVREWGERWTGREIFPIEVPNCVALAKYTNVVLRDSGRNDESQFHILQHPHQAVSLSERQTLLCALLPGCGPTLRSTMAVATGPPSYGGSCGQKCPGSQLAQREPTAIVGCGLTKLVRAVLTVLIACCLLRLQGTQLYKSVFLSAVEIWIDLAWKNPFPLSSCNGDKTGPFSLLPKILLHFFCRWPPSNSPCC